MSAPGIVTQEIKQVGAPVGDEVGICEEINRKWGLTCSLHKLAFLSLCCLPPAGKIPQGNLGKWAPSPVHPNPNCSYSVPTPSRFGGGVLNSSIVCSNTSWILWGVVIVFYFFLTIFLNLPLLLCWRFFLSIWCLSKEKATDSNWAELLLS